MRILLVEDEVELGSVIRDGLVKAHFCVDWVRTGDAALRRTEEGGYALVVLDLMLPHTDGWEVCRRLRARRDLTPILMLTARDSVDDRVRGLELGADDYLSKPFDFKELRARVRALLRRDAQHRGRVIQVADLEIDTGTRQVRRGGREIPLTPRQYSLLEALALREGQVLSREWIQERVWGDSDSYSNTVEVYIGLLRRKIDPEGTERLIHTVHRQGYTLRDPSRGDAR